MSKRAHKANFHPGSIVLWRAAAIIRVDNTGKIGFFFSKFNFGLELSP